MVPAVRPLRSLSTARSCARIDSRPDTAKIGSADRVEVHHARLLAVIGVRKTFPHSLDPYRKSASAPRRGWPCPIPTVHRCQISTSSGGSDASRIGISVRGDIVDLATRNPDIH